jgi:arginase family enzyme
MARVGLDDSLERALSGVDGVYVALDLDVFDPAHVDVLTAEPEGLAPEEGEALLRRIAERTTIVGTGVSGFLRTDRNAALVARMLAAAGF